MNPDINVQSPQSLLSRLLGLYKAEWLNGELFELFTEPGYFGHLTTARPCVLTGGRGTGKTTVLRGLSYEGQFALAGTASSKVRDWDLEFPRFSGHYAKPA
jgi:hypothetical protein